MARYVCIESEELHVNDIKLEVKKKTIFQVE